jgi:hypothetical protein
METENSFGSRMGLTPCGRILEQDGWNVWCCSPIYGDDGRVHVFYSRWRGSFNCWIATCEVGHAVADRPEGPYTHVDVALAGRGGDAWDSWSIHNPTIHKVGDRYALFYMGSDGSGLGIQKEDLAGMSWAEYEPYYRKLVETKRIGLAVSHSLDGPWERVGDVKPLLDCGPRDAWDDVLVSNPAFVQKPDGTCMLYYKGLDFKSWHRDFGNRKIGLAVADRLEGPYRKIAENPLISFEHIPVQSILHAEHADSRPENYAAAQVEDPYIWLENGRFRAMMRDMGLFNHQYGILLESEDGIYWPPDPRIAYREAASYFNEPSNGLPREGRLERPQLLMRDGRPDYPIVGS